MKRLFLISLVVLFGLITVVALFTYILKPELQKEAFVTSIGVNICLLITVYLLSGKKTEEETGEGEEMV